MTPAVSAITGDSHKNAEVRQGLQPLVDLAGSLDAALLGITHLAKGSAGRDPVERVIGSIAFSAVARVVLVAAKVKGDDGQDKRVLVRSKSNTGQDVGGFEYHISEVEVKPGITPSIVTWGKPIEGTARELLAEAESDPNNQISALGLAKEFLRQLLADDAVPVKQVKTETENAGLAWRTVKQASNALGVKPKKDGMQGGWYWSLPEGVQKNAKVSTQNDGHLWEGLDTFGGYQANPVAPIANCVVGGQA